MKPNRREFHEVTGAAIALSAVPINGLSSPSPLPYDSPLILQGDPYLASACDGGLGGDSFDELRDRMMRERTSGEALHRAALGLEREDA